MPVHHVFLTRFNLPSQGAESLIRAREGWLRDRIELFERFTVPSVRAQTETSAGWLVYLDPESPAWLLDRMTVLEAEGLVTPIRRTTAGLAEDLRRDLASTVKASHGDVLVTTNLDNDDGLASTFVARVTAVTTGAPRTAVYLTEGLIRSPDGLFARRDRHNAFCSVREDYGGEPVTCWADWHNLLHLTMPVVEIGGEPGWLQVVHGANVSNRVRGRLVSPSSHVATFGDLISDLAVPARGTVVRDRLIGGPWRTAKESSRALAKGAIMRVGGKHGLDRIKQMRSARSRTRRVDVRTGPRGRA